MFPPGMTVLSFGEGYRKYFEIVPAVTEELKRENYRLRHEVYCRDLGWEPLRDDGMETDAFDRHSIHCLIRAISTGLFVGCARVVLTDPDDPSRPLPFEKACAQTLDRSAIDPATCERSTIAEISRLAILGRYRRRKGEGTSPFVLDDNFGEAERLRLPYLPLGLYLGLMALAKRNGIKTLFVLTEPRLAASITRLGVNVQQIGGPIEHRGTRIPSAMDVESIIDGMNPFVRPFYETITQEVAAGIELAAAGARFAPAPAHGCG